MWKCERESVNGSETAGGRKLEWGKNRSGKMAARVDLERSTRCWVQMRAERWVEFSGGARRDPRGDELDEGEVRI